MKLVPCATDGAAVARALKLGARADRFLWVAMKGDDDVRAPLEKLRAGLPANTLLMVVGSGAPDEAALALADGSARLTGCVSCAITPGPKAVPAEEALS
eukprot:5327643-Prymnesium_polylepis.1